MNAPNQSVHSVAIQVFCSIEQEKLEALATMMNELIPLVPIPNAEHFQGVIVVPDEQRELVINDLLKEYDESAGAYVSGTEARACAMPMEVPTDDGKVLACLIFLAESLVQEINPMHYHSGDLISTLLEELCHVRHYSITWQQRGYIHSCEADICKKDLLTMCSNFQDEYVAIRWKAFLMASIPLVEISEGNKSVVHLRYGSPVASLLDQASSELSQISLDAADKKLSIDDAWSKLLQTVYRKIFEPLARNEAFSAVIPANEDIPSQSASDSLFYQQFVEPYWEKTKTQLERSFNNDLEEQEIALNEMAGILDDFLRGLGVTHSKTSGGDYYIEIGVVPS
jgi:hypothetical protein